MQSRALDRIRQAKANNSDFLDLSRENLEMIPAELLELQHLRNLRLSSIHLTADDICALSTLPNLKSLDLYRCRIGAEHAHALASLTNLTILNLCWVGLGDECVSTLSSLTNLRVLMLESNNIGADGTYALSSLTNLIWLFLAGNRINSEGSKALSPLINLSMLDLNGNRIEAEGAQALSSLTNLSELRLHGNMIGDEGAHALSSLTNLTKLDLGHNCVRAKGARSLSLLTNLTSLELWNNYIGDEGARALSSLTKLISLNLALNDIGNEGARTLSSLTNLTSLTLRGNPITRFAPLVPLLDHLEYLDTLDCNFSDIPPEIPGSNWIESVRAHFRDLAFDAKRDAEFKVCVLGNGGTGKTQMCRRLRGEPFYPSIPTTHGIQLGHLETTFDGQPARLNLWDFGGQDIYYGSHALFLQGQAVFVILWTPSLESGTHQDGGATVRHRPLSYWLDFVRGLSGTDNPVLVVQSQCDEIVQRVAPLMETSEFRLVRHLSFSARTDLGLKVLQGELDDAIRDLHSRQLPVQIGAGRVELRNQLREMLEQDQARPADKREHRTLSLADFEELCRTNGKVSDAAALLDYLHRTGVVFYRQGLFSDRIILDQNWALEAIYSLFDRARTLPVINRHGRFTRRELHLLVWQMFSIEEQKLFLQMMESCGICFKVRNLTPNTYPEEWEYVAPELLPEWSEIQDWLLGRMQGGREEATAKVEYRFLHEGILRGFLSGLGHRARDAAVYWKYGCWFWEKSNASQILIRSELDAKTGGGVVQLRAVGERPWELLETVLHELRRIPLGVPPEVRRSRDESVARDQTRRLEQLEVPDHPNLPSGAKPSIYVSYAWGDDRSKVGRQRQTAVDGLCAMLDRTGYEVLKDDRVLRHGDWISTFMKSIGRGDHVLLILSKKYLRSIYCMTELFYIYNRSLGEKEDFLKRIIPVVVEKSLKLNDWRSVLDHVEYWESVSRDMQPNLTKLGQTHFQQFKQIEKWQRDIGDMLGFICDVLQPRGFDAIIEADYAAVRQMLPPIGAH